MASSTGDGTSELNLSSQSTHTVYHIASARRLSSRRLNPPTDGVSTVKAVVYALLVALKERTNLERVPLNYRELIHEFGGMCGDGGNDE